MTKFTDEQIREAANNFDFKYFDKQFTKIYGKDVAETCLDRNTSQQTREAAIRFGLDRKLRRLRKPLWRQILHLY